MKRIKHEKEKNMKRKKQKCKRKKNIIKRYSIDSILCLNAILGVISLGQPSLENCLWQDWKSPLSGLRHQDDPKPRDNRG